MSQNQKTRSKLMIGALVRAAAAGSAPGFNPPRKLAAIAGLAGFVLRLFRSRDVPAAHPRGKKPRGSTQTASRPSPRCRSRLAPKRPARIQQGSPKAVRRKPRAHPPVFPGANGIALARSQGGIHHG